MRLARPAALTELLPEKVAAAAYEFITGPLLDDPHRVGKPLDPPMAPAWTARRGTYRILYLLDEPEPRTVAQRIPWDRSLAWGGRVASWE